MAVTRSIFFFCSQILLISENVAVIGGSSYPPEVLKEASLDTEQLIREQNYPAETHFVTTDDGYILRMHRIKAVGGKPIFLQHGLLDTSATFVIMGPTISLGYFLHDKGYDVWLGNARGNRYSRNHTTVSPENNEFWNFSWHEIAIHDIPAMIDYVLETTGNEKLYYVGHSQGTTVLFVMCSLRPEYNNKIILAHALAPGAFFKHIRTTALTYIESYLKLPTTKPYGEFMPNADTFRQICESTRYMEDMCINAFFMIVGKDPDQFNRTTLPKIMGHIPAGSSIKQVIHYFQLTKSNLFCQFDYGSNNQKVYGQATPPSYDLSLVTCPIVLYYSLNDLLSEPVDVLRLGDLLPNKVEAYKVEYRLFNHMDFVYSKMAREIYEHMEELNQKYP